MENAGDNSKTSLFIQLADKINNPVADLLAGSSGSGKEGQAKKAMLQNLQTNSLKEGKHQLDCGLAKIMPSNLKKLNVKYMISGYGSNSIEMEIPQSLFHIEIFPTGTGLDKYLVQEVIKEYAAKNLLSFERERTFKIVWIHNIDELSYYAQTALRCTMEKYCKTCKFILTGKQLSKIIEPLRSRCLSIWCHYLNSCLWSSFQQLQRRS